MKTHITDSLSRRRSGGGFTLIEVLIASGLSVMLFSVLGALSLYGSRSFASLANYVDLDNKSRETVDLLSRDIRQATAVISVQTNLPVRSLTLTNAHEGTSMVLTWNSAAGTLVVEKTGQLPQTKLVGCDSWNFSLYQRTPQITPTNILVYPAVNAAGAVDVSRCKVIDMTWKCSRTIMGQKVNSESVQTAQVVLRNKQ